MILNEATNWGWKSAVVSGYPMGGSIATNSMAPVPLLPFPPYSPPCPPILRLRCRHIPRRCLRCHKERQCGSEELTTAPPPPPYFPPLPPLPDRETAPLLTTTPPPPLPPEPPLPPLPSELMSLRQPGCRRPPLAVKFPKRPRPTV